MPTPATAEGLARTVGFASLGRMKGLTMCALLATGAVALVLYVIQPQASGLPTPAGEPNRGHTAAVQDPGSPERAPVDSAATKSHTGVAANVPVAVEMLPDDLPARVGAVVERLRKCERQHRVHWRTPEKFTISADNARRLIADFEHYDAQCVEAEQQYRAAHMSFVDDEIDAGRGILATADINQVRKDLESAGKYDPARDHLGYGIRFEAGTFYVLAKRGTVPALDPQLDYCDSMTQAYREVCGRLLSYLNF